MTTGLVQSPSGNAYFDPVFGKPAIKVLPGHYHITGEDKVLVTVLGSCVAACIRDRHSGIGGMNHFMLPEAGDDAFASEPARYGAYAMEVLINQLVKNGARRDRLEAKVFGGANVVAGMTQAGIGRRNAQFVLEFLAREGIPLLARDLEDTCARKVAYFPRTGEARVRRLAGETPRQWLSHESSYRRQLVATPIAGTVELFQEGP
ncbi:MAG: chemoreceptor glutamine deamidase CheD [Burkholderiales bacterium]|jgi:chemotaxis protein CheD|nr:chemoreceptor glutamine deamidase CheD [Burkholderiales bacterium]